MKEQKCHHCGNSKFVYGKQSDYGAVSKMNFWSLNSQTLIHVICLNCGTIVRSYINNPELLVKK